MEKINKILAPIDFSDFSKHALKYSVEMAEHFSAELFLIYVIEPSFYPADFSMGQISVPTAELETIKHAREQLDLLAEEKIRKRVKYNTMIKTGRPFVEIIDTASEEDIDLIIISTHGHTGMEHLLFGSTAEKVVRKAPCPVLTLREPLKGFRFRG